MIYENLILKPRNVTHRQQRTMGNAIAVMATHNATAAMAKAAAFGTEKPATKTEMKKVLLQVVQNCSFMKIKPIFVKENQLMKMMYRKCYYIHIMDTSKAYFFRRTNAQRSLFYSHCRTTRMQNYRWRCFCSFRNMERSIRGRKNHRDRLQVW